MATPRKDALTRFTDKLIRLRILAGKPTLNRLVVLTADLEHPLARSTISDKLTAKSVPDWDFVVSFVTGCRRYAKHAGIPLGADLVNQARWDAEHWEMLSTLDGLGGEDRLAVAARAEIGRRGNRTAVERVVMPPSPDTEMVVTRLPSALRHLAGDDRELAVLAGLLEGLRAGEGGTVMIFVAGGPTDHE